MNNQFFHVLDELDIAILRELQEDGRITNIELARRINLSPPATHARLKNLEERGFIRRYTALLNHEQLGYDMVCLVLISIQNHRSDAVEFFQDSIKLIPEILECYHITGEFDFILKVVIHDRRGLERFLVERLAPIPNITRIQTALVIREVKSTTALPLDF